MNRLICCRWRLLFVLLAMLLPCSVADAGGPVVVSVKPVRGNYRVGELIAVEVWAENITDLYGADVRLTFDSAKLTVVDADPARPGVQVTPRADLLSPDLVVRREADNQAGTIWYAATQLNPREPASGSGALFAFTLRVLSPGLHSVRIQYQQLSTRDAELIPADTQDARYWASIDGGAPWILLFPLMYFSN
jgi:hypothetical protein